MTETILTPYKVCLQSDADGSLIPVGYFTNLVDAKTFQEIKSRQGNDTWVILPVNASLTEQQINSILKDLAENGINMSVTITPGLPYRVDWWTDKENRIFKDYPDNLREYLNEKITSTLW